MIMKRTGFIIFVFSIVFLSCQNTWYVVDDKANNEVKHSAMSYYLPETSLHIQVEYTQYHFTPGPYARFAEEMLSIRGVSTQEKRYWAITGVEFTESVLPDRNHRYWIVPDGANPSVSLTEGGILAGINSGESVSGLFSTSSHFYPAGQENPAELPFMDLQIDKNTREVIDTTYRTIMRDSVVQRISVYKRREVGKNLKHKAQDAADFIIRIRKNRFSLEAAIEEQKVSGVDIAYMIDKLEELEQSYLDLFTGKLESATITKHYHVTPGMQPRKETHILDRLEKQVPVSLQDEMEGQTLSMSVVPQVKAENSPLQEDETERKAALIYRRPLPVQYLITLDGDAVYQQQGLCPQKGSVVKLPANLVNQDSEIRLNPKTGEIHSIKHIE